MLQIHCEGTPYQIGLKHGQEAKLQISRCLNFYAGMFQETAKMDWGRVQQLAMTFESIMERKWPAYLEEMHGVADGAGVDMAEIIAINVRTEIAFGMFSDGCTALSWRTEYASFLAQNWDWMEAQKENLIILTIEQTDKPTIKMVTEAGLIGKIGMNSAGVGVCLNAIKAKGMDPTRIPCHLGLRMVLESQSRDEAVQKLEKYGVASSCHMLVADAHGGVGLEWSSVELQKVPMNVSEQVFHSNHYLRKHKGVEDTNWLGDSNFRVVRIEELCKSLGGHPNSQNLFELFKDEANYPGSICRSQLDGAQSASLFNIIMDLQARTATVTLGRPVAPEEVVQLVF
ncbi:hypothetical protein BAUCODRAFT_68242 [Baudoinia panamericana UAMH 10762]|uniref:Peptidase C45 hydrolase domain-containing protein n=1 Tax=Baudoinia panamericana (strain UAMH 10762) TaxID=717646 RepID=M2N120_BAUPA|nr:uncharacterized protein BAUCODRAFT_68242 [Baudoinia panamericana UAMH 10762]EMC97628.1 hypothetical protein BAUCODRAFT_68242 [Baudoinia panamericana UAMH 10762]